MMTLKIKKEDLDKQLWPMSVEEVLVFGTTLLGTPGIFGIKNNHLCFIPMENIPGENVISIPENLEEVMGFLGSADYILNRVMMTPEIVVDGFNNSEITNEVLRKEVMTIFNNFMRSYHERNNILDRIKNGW